MDKYIVISDISKYPCYKNVNARLLYLHVACHLDTRTYTYYHSIRTLANDIGMTVAAVRHALGLLVKDGLITLEVTVPTTTHYATHKIAQPTTHIHIVTIKDLQQPNNTPCDTRNDTPCDTHINKKIKKSKKNRLSAEERKTKIFKFEESGGNLIAELLGMMQEN